MTTIEDKESTHMTSKALHARASVGLCHPGWHPHTTGADRNRDTETRDRQLVTTQRDPGEERFCA